MYWVPALGSEQHGKLTAGHVLNFHTQAVQASSRITATNFKIGTEPLLMRMQSRPST